MLAIDSNWFGVAENLSRCSCPAPRNNRMARTGSCWTEYEQVQLLDGLAAGKTIKQLADILDRSEGSVLGRIQVSAYRQRLTGVDDESAICDTFRLTAEQLARIMELEARKRADRRRHGQMLARSPRCTWY